VLQVSEKEIELRLRLDNPWWEAGAGIDAEYQGFPRRAYLPAFAQLVRQAEVNRAVVLLGPRRVGKTILAHHCIQQLLDEGAASGRDILYVSLETPLFTGLTLEDLVQRFRRLFVRPAAVRLIVFFDEIQYLRDWEVHLKSLVDTHRDCRFVATGSAAAALKTRSAESGAGRFTEFVLPPLTFAEYLRFVDREEELISPAPAERGASRFAAADIHSLNEEFVRYLNFGGYPEAVFKPGVRADPRRFIKSDIIDKVLLRDLPSLYGIADVQELNRLFNTLAYNTAGELSLEELSKTSHVAKVTLTRYLEYLEAAFLIRRMRRVDQDAGHFRRVTTFKVFLTNPTMRAALFGPVNERHEAMGQLTETAVVSQWLHNASYVESLYYARWPRGEVDLVSLDPAGQRPRLAVEVKWSDRAFDDPMEIKGLIEFARRHSLRLPLVTTVSRTGMRQFGDVSVEFVPASLHCYIVARNTLENSPLP
jgi:hypothetical protein